MPNNNGRENNYEELFEVIIGADRRLIPGLCIHSSLVRRKCDGLFKISVPR